MDSNQMEISNRVCSERFHRLMHGKMWDLAFLLVLSLVLFALYHSLIVRRAVVEMEVETDTRTIFKVYWPGPGGLYAEKRMSRINIKPGLEHYRFRICDITSVDHIRIDTSERPARVVIKKLSVVQQGVEPLVFDTPEKLKAIQVLEGIAERTLDEKGLAIVPEGRDPKLVLPLPPLDRHAIWPSELVMLLVMTVLVLFLYQTTHFLVHHDRFVLYLLCFVLALIVVMAVVSKNNKHPDEFVHVQAAGYYQDHVLPPRIGAPEIRDTYSPYGVSRLHSGEIVYLFAGKFQKLIREFVPSTYLSVRLFNIALFLGLCLLALNRPVFRPFMLPVLISPQIWYVFSYFDSDAFSLVVGMLAAYQLSAPGTMFARLLSDEAGKKKWLFIVVLGFLLGFLLLVKKNFYFLWVFLFLLFFWKLWTEKIRMDRRCWQRIALILLTGCMVFGLFRGADLWVNDFRKGELLLQAREEFALPLFKPSTPLDHKHIYLQMRDRGISLKRIIQIDRWGEKSFRTSFGVYGYTEISASFTYYDLVRVVSLLLLGAVVLSIAVRGRLPAHVLLAMTLILSVALLAMALYRAWTVDFQAQGRYFLPIVPMLSVLVYSIRTCLIRRLFYPLFWAMFFLSVYNFVFVGLYEIAKYGA